tara:strand:- start:1419 stop:2276 length:858 start_codon:yes stop_codon:yes gene_type:complete
LDTDTFTNTDIINFAEKNFINIKINTDNEYGYELFKKYNGQGLPTILFINPDGSERDRFVGYYDSDAYLEKMNDVYNNINTLDYYLDQYKLNSTLTDISLKIGNKYIERNQNKNAKKYYENVLLDGSEKQLLEATYKLAYLEYENANFKPLIKFINEYPNSDFTYSALRSLIRYYKGQNNKIEELKYYEKLILSFPRNPQALNSYSWRMSELGMNLEKALNKVQLAVELTQNDPSVQANILDTEAELLWKLTKTEEAIIVINKALKIDPENEYYQEQKNKFLESL